MVDIIISVGVCEGVGNVNIVKAEPVAARPHIIEPSLVDGAWDGWKVSTDAHAEVASLSPGLVGFVKFDAGTVAVFAGPVLTDSVGFSAVGFVSFVTGTDAFIVGFVDGLVQDVLVFTAHKSHGFTRIVVLFGTAESNFEISTGSIFWLFVIDTPETLVIVHMGDCGGTG